MRADHLQDGTIGVSGTARIEIFNRIWAGMGWPERDAGYLCVVGERTDGRYHCIWEKRGGLWELGDAALEAKDRFLIDCIWVDARDDVAAAYLRTLHGLCFYDDREGFFCKHSDPSRPRSDVPRFRDLQTTTAVMPVPERVLTNYRSALERVRGVIMTGRLLVHQVNCPVLVYTLRQPIDDLIGSTVMKGLVWVATALEDTRNVSPDYAPPAPWYSNLPRE